MTLLSCTSHSNMWNGSLFCHDSNSFTLNLFYSIDELSSILKPEHLQNNYSCSRIFQGFIADIHNKLIVHFNKYNNVQRKRAEMQFHAADVINVLSVAVFSGSDDGMLEDLDAGYNC